MDRYGGIWTIGIEPLSEIAFRNHFHLQIYIYTDIKEDPCDRAIRPERERER